MCVRARPSHAAVPATCRGAFSRRRADSSGGEGGACAAAMMPQKLRSDGTELVQNNSSAGASGRGSMKSYGQGAMVGFKASAWPRRRRAQRRSERSCSPDHPTDRPKRCDIWGTDLGIAAKRRPCGARSRRLLTRPVSQKAATLRYPTVRQTHVSPPTYKFPQFRRTLITTVFHLVFSCSSSSSQFKGAFNKSTRFYKLQGIVLNA